MRGQCARMRACMHAHRFPISVGTHITGVDANTYSITGDAFSTVVLPGEHSTTSVVLQEEDCSLGEWLCVRMFECVCCLLAF